MKQCFLVFVPLIIAFFNSMKLIFTIKGPKKSSACVSGAIPPGTAS